VIGNDIIDLTFAKKGSNWKRPRFIEKIFTCQEQKYIKESQQTDKMVWLLWSMKESAYKLHVQLFKKRFFAPKRFACSIVELDKYEVTGKVVCGNFQCYTKSEVSDEFVYTFSKIYKNESHLGQTFIIKNSDYKTQHELVYQKVKAQFAEFTGAPSEQISIRKNDIGIPSFWFKKEKANIALSMTHHGNFGAFVISNTNCGF